MNFEPSRSFAIEKLNNAEGTYYIMNRTKKNAEDFSNDIFRFLLAV